MAGRVVTIATQRGGVGVITRAVAGVTSTRRPVFTATHVADRNLLGRMLNQLVEWVDNVTQAARSNPLNTAVVIKGIAMSAGVTYQLPHSLGRAYIGWICTRAQTAAWAGYETALATGLTADRYIAIYATNTGTFDFLVF